MAASDGGAEDEARALELAREVATLRARDDARRRELSALQEKVAALATRLQETTDELEQRAQFSASAVAQITRLEGDAAAANRAVLSREMQLQDAAQEKRALEATLRSKEQECAHWEAEYQRVDALLDAQKRAYSALESVLERKKRKGKQRKVQSLKLATALSEMRQHVERLQDTERQLLRVAEEKDAKAAAVEQTWVGRLEREQHVAASLQAQILELERERLRAVEAESLKTREAVMEEKSEQVENLHGQLRDMETAVNRLRTKEELFRREVVRLREELLLSESQRATDQRRHEQLIRGRDKEVAFIWKKYVGVISSLPRERERKQAGRRESAPMSGSAARSPTPT